MRTHSSTPSLKTGPSKSPLRPWLCNLTGFSNQHNTGRLSSFKEQLLLGAVLKLFRVILQELWKYSFFLTALTFSLIIKQLVSMLAQYVPQTSSICQNGYSWEIMLQFYYWLLVEGPQNMDKILWDLRIFFRTF